MVNLLFAERTGLDMHGLDMHAPTGEPTRPDNLFLHIDGTSADGVEVHTM